MQIIEVHHYDTLHEFLNKEGWKNAALHLGSFDETEKAYLQFYPGDFIKKAGGMNGIRSEWHYSGHTTSNVVEDFIT